MIDLAEYLMGREVSHGREFNPDIRRKALLTVELINKLLALAKGAGCKITPRRDGTLTNSGWRPPSLNATTPGASATSLHMTGEAIDLNDPTGELGSWCTRNAPTVLADLGLWLEHTAATPGWVHLQTKPPRSGARIFRP